MTSTTTTKRAKVIATHQTYNPYDCTSTGYDIEIRDDGTMRLTSRSRWQGSRDGQVYIVPTPPEIIAALNAGDDEPDLETAVSDWLSTQYKEDWRMIRKGHVVQ